MPWWWLLASIAIYLGDLLTSNSAPRSLQSSSSLPFGLLLVNLHAKVDSKNPDNISWFKDNPYNDGDSKNPDNFNCFKDTPASAMEDKGYYDHPCSPDHSAIPIIEPDDNVPPPPPTTTGESWGDPIPRTSHLPTWLHMLDPLVLTTAVHVAPQALHPTTTHPHNNHRLQITSSSASPLPTAPPPLATSTSRRPNYTIKTPSPPILIAQAGRFPSSLALTLMRSSPISISCILMLCLSVTYPSTSSLRATGSS